MHLQDTVITHLGQTLETTPIISKRNSCRFALIVIIIVPSVLGRKMVLSGLILPIVQPGHICTPVCLCRIICDCLLKFASLHRAWCIPSRSVHLSVVGNESFAGWLHVSLLQIYLITIWLSPKTTMVQLGLPSGQIQQDPPNSRSISIQQIRRLQYLGGKVGVHRRQYDAFVTLFQNLPWLQCRCWSLARSMLPFKQSTTSNLLGRSSWVSDRRCWSPLG
jgi:hypothetical protein